MAAPSDPTGFRMRARLVDLPTDEKEKVFAYACGINFCDSAPTFQGRLVDIVDNKKVFAVASECRHPDTFQPISFVLVAEVPPFGISNVVRFQFNLTSTPANNCWGDSRCPISDLVWDGSAWIGEIVLLSGTIDVSFTYEGTVMGVPQFKITFTGCLDGFLLGTMTCSWPFLAGGGGVLPAIDNTCCDGVVQPATTCTYSIESYTNWRYAGRLVDIDDGMKVFAIGECCEALPDCPLEVDCCGCLVNPLQWEFDVSGVTAGTCGVPCLNYNTHWVLTYTSLCSWASDDVGICTPGTSWGLTCDVGSGKWTLSTRAVGTPAVYQIDVADWECFGPNTLTKISNHSACGNFPATITITAV